MSQPPHTPGSGAPGAAGPPEYPAPPGTPAFGPGPGQPPGGPARRSSNTVVIIIAVVVASLFACGIFSALGIYGVRRYLARARAAGAPASGPVAAGADAGGSPAPSTGTAIESTDGLSTITVAPGWRSMPELGTEGVVRAGSSASDEYLLVISEPKADFAPHVDLAKYGEVVTGAMQQKMVGPQMGSAVPLTVGGRPALQYELSGAVDVLNLGYLVTVVDGAKHYHQILMWTTKSKLAGSRAGFERTTATFRER